VIFSTWIRVSCTEKEKPVIWTDLNVTKFGFWATHRPQGLSVNYWTSTYTPQNPTSCHGGINRQTNYKICRERLPHTHLCLPCHTNKSHNKHVYIAIVFLFGTMSTGGKIYISSQANPNACGKMWKNGKIYIFPHRPGGKAVTERHGVCYDWMELVLFKNGVKFVSYITEWRYNSLGRYTPTSYRGVPGSMPGRVIWGFGGRSSTEIGFLQVLWFPLPILIPSTAP
jgi:hypothetical protein